MTSFDSYNAFCEMYPHRVYKNLDISISRWWLETPRGYSECVHTQLTFENLLESIYKKEDLRIIIPDENHIRLLLNHADEIMHWDEGLSYNAWIDVKNYLEFNYAYEEDSSSLLKKLCSLKDFGDDTEQKRYYALISKFNLWCHSRKWWFIPRCIDKFVSQFVERLKTFSDEDFLDIVFLKRIIFTTMSKKVDIIESFLESCDEDGTLTITQKKTNWKFLIAPKTIDGKTTYLDFFKWDLLSNAGLENRGIKVEEDIALRKEFSTETNWDSKLLNAFASWKTNDTSSYMSEVMIASMDKFLSDLRLEMERMANERTLDDTLEVLKNLMKEDTAVGLKLLSCQKPVSYLDNRNLFEQLISYMTFAHSLDSESYVIDKDIIRAIIIDDYDFRDSEEFRPLKNRIDSEKESLKTSLASLLKNY